MITKPSYVQTVLHLRWLLDAVEVWLETLPDTAPINLLQLQAVETKRVAAHDEVAVVFAALSELGIIVPGSPPRLSRQALMGTAGYRCGVRDMAEGLPKQEQAVRICATLPTSLTSVMKAALLEEVLDLRAVLYDLLAGAHSRIVIASPFWDSVTVHELSVLLRRRLSSGVHVDVLGRIEKSAGNDYSAFANQFTASQNIHFYNWYEPNSNDLFGSQTFHFKTIVIDNGSKAYVGSANMTSSGLRSRMELGIILRGSPSATVATILDEVLRIAIRI